MLKNTLYAKNMLTSVLKPLILQEDGNIVYCTRGRMKMNRVEFDKKLKSLKIGKEDMQWIRSMLKEMEEAEKEGLAFPISYEAILQQFE